LATHPDLNKDNDGEEFKAIADAHSVLSSPTERMKYDRQLHEASMWRKPSGRGFYNSDSIRRPGARPPPRGFHVAMETLSNPRYIVFGIAAFGSFAALLGSVTSKRPELHLQKSMIEAWHNPRTNQWEQPAPWDPVYRRLQPKLQLVPRDKVRRRNKRK
jgi:curved DNA-binding protein CbpA